MPRSEMAEQIISKTDSMNLTAADVRKVMSMFFKAGLMIKIENKHGLDGEETCWKVNSLPEEKVFYKIDRAMIACLLSGLEESDVPFKKESISPLLLQRRTISELNALITDARQP